MSAKQYHVALSKQERQGLSKLLRKGTVKARQLTRARILLLADQGQSDEQIVAALGTSLSTVQRIRRRFSSGDLAAALQEQPRPGAVPKLDARTEAHLTVLACSEAPDGRARWTLQLLADRLVELKLVDSVSRTTVWQALKKTNSSLGSTTTGASGK
jgi:transposase